MPLTIFVKCFTKNPKCSGRFGCAVCFHILSLCIRFIPHSLMFGLFCSSFDEYSSELKSGRLEWSPVHKSEKFWRENAVRLNEKNYELLK